MSPGCHWDVRVRSNRDPIGMPDLSQKSERDTIGMPESTVLTKHPGYHWDPIDINPPPASTDQDVRQACVPKMFIPRWFRRRLEVTWEWRNVETDVESAHSGTLRNSGRNLLRSVGKYHIRLPGLPAPYARRSTPPRIW